MNELSTSLDRSLEKTMLSRSICFPTKDKVHNLIISRLPTQDKPLGKAAEHHFSKPGKMLRAKMAVHGAEALNLKHAYNIKNKTNTLIAIIIGNNR